MTCFSLSPVRRFLATAVTPVLAGALLASGVARVSLHGQQPGPGGQTTSAAPLRILVIAGEDAVNIVQQKSAVSPVVEVRDRNGIPMAGIPVTFKIAGNNAAFGANAQTLTVTTNAAGRAAAGAMTPMSPGVVQIQASASAQGQVATAVITQTNFATVAAATAAGATVAGAAGTAAATGGGAGAAAAGAGAATGGGLSATTIGIIAGAAGGGTLAARQLTKDDTPAQKTYTGSYSVQRVENITLKPSGTACTLTWRSDGTLTMTIEEAQTSVSGSVDVVIVETVLSTTCPQGSTQPPGFVEPGGGTLPVTGTKDAVQFDYQKNDSNGFGSSSSTLNFLGTLANGVVNGTITGTEQSDGPNETSSSFLSIPITLR